VTPDYGENYGDILASGIESYLGHKRKEKADARAEEEYAYTKGRREKLDPIEEALLRAQLYEQGIVRDEDDGGGLPDAIEGERQAPAFRGKGGLTGRASTGLRAPGSFNPATGTFNPPFDIDPGFTAPRLPGYQPDTDPGFTAPRVGPEIDIDPGFRAPVQSGRRGDRVPLGGGYELDESRTPEGRKESMLARQIEAAVRAGIPRDEAEIEIRGGGLSSEHFHPGAFHPRTRQQYDEIEAQQHQYRLAEIGAREAASRRGQEKDDPALKERRDSWKQQLGTPRNQLEQDVLDFLADGEKPEEIAGYFRQDQRQAVEDYLSGEHADVEDRRYEMGRGARRRRTP